MKQPHYYSIDTRRDLIVPGNTEATLSFCVEHFYTCMKQAIEHRGKATIALSGGSTPKAIYERVAKHSLAENFPWDKVYLFFSDERAVPPDHADSNYHMAMTYGLGSLPIPPSHVFRMQAEARIQNHAIEYEKSIFHIMEDGSFDLLMLGMGEDGHTASLFPGTTALSEDKHLVAANYIPEKDAWRMTLTFPCINKARHIAFYVLGENKKARLEDVLFNSHVPPLPASQVGVPFHKALWICDEAAASDIKKKFAN